MPDFLNFPPETTYIMSSYLNRKDLCALRQTCRRVEQHTYDCWVAECFTDVYVLPTRYALDKLCRISKNDRVRPTVRHVHIMSTPYAVHDKHSDHYQPMIRLEEGSDESVPFPSPQYAWQLSVDTFWNYVHSRSFQELLVQALTLFGTIKLSVLDSKLSNDIYLWGRAEELRKKEINFCSASTSIPTWERLRDTMHTYIGAAILRICRTNSVAELTLGKAEPWYLAPFHILRPEDMQPIIHLRSLSIAPISGNTSEGVLQESHLCSLFGLLPNLRHLTLDMSHLVHPEYVFLHAPITTLASLNILCASHHASLNLMDFLDGLSNTLQKLHFEVYTDDLLDDVYERRPWISIMCALSHRFPLLSNVSFGGSSELPYVFAGIAKKTEAGEKNHVTAILDEYVRLLELADDDERDDVEDEEGGDEI